MKFPVLISYAYARNDLTQFREIIERPHVELLLDCGAFTAKNAGETINLEDYCRFLDEWGDKIFRYLALDVVGDPKATDANLKEMLRAGYKPVPVHVLGDDQRRMDELFEMSDYVACAGLRRPHKGGAPKEYVAAKMKWAAGRDVHWLGYVREPMIAAFRPYSCDSASWASAHMYGSARIYLGRGRWLDAKYQERDKLLRNAEAMRILSSIGFSSKDVHDPLCWKNSVKDGYSSDRFLSMAATADSWVRYAIDVYRRFSTKIFLATVMPGGGRETFTAAIDRHADKLHLDTLHV
jgi:hypothetical protein